jgi:hypothetical protein
MASVLNGVSVVVGVSFGATTSARMARNRFGISVLGKENNELLILW